MKFAPHNRNNFQIISNKIKILGVHNALKTIAKTAKTAVFAGVVQNGGFALFVPGSGYIEKS